MYKRRWTAPTIGRSRRGPPWPLGRIKRPVPNVRGGGSPVPNGLTDSPGGDLSGGPPQQVPFTDPNANYANYGMPNPSLPQQLQQLPPQELQQLGRLPPQMLQRVLQQMPAQVPSQEPQQPQRLSPQILQQALQQMPPQVPGQLLPQMPQQMARGGVVTKPTVAVVGERGPEAVVKICPRMSYRRKE